MGSSHPFADFRFLFAEHIGKVILFKTPLFQYAMNPVNYKERQVNTPTDFG